MGEYKKHEHETDDPEHELRAAVEGGCKRRRCYEMGEYTNETEHETDDPVGHELRAAVEGFAPNCEGVITR